MDGYVSSWAFVAEYCAYIFIAVTGILQLVAARWEFRGVSFFGSKRWGYIFGAAAIGGVFLWFFAFTGLDLAQPTFDTPPQLIWLSVSTICAILFTLALSSAINRKMSPPADDEATPEEGLDALKRMTYWRAIGRYLKRGKTP